MEGCHPEGDVSFSVPADSIHRLILPFLDLGENTEGKPSQNITHYHSPWVLKHRQALDRNNRKRGWKSGRRARVDLEVHPIQNSMDNYDQLVRYCGVIFSTDRQLP